MSVSGRAIIMEAFTAHPIVIKVPPMSQSEVRRLVAELERVRSIHPTPFILIPEDAVIEFPIIGIRGPRPTECR